MLPYGLGQTPALLLGVWNLGMFPEEGAYMTSPQENPWLLGLLQASLTGNISHVLWQLETRGITRVLCNSTGRVSWKLVPGLPQTSPMSQLLFTDFVKHSFTGRNHSHEYDYMLSPVSPLSESLNLGPPIHCPNQHSYEVKEKENRR